MMDGWVRPTSSSRTRRREPEERASVVVADGYSNERASVGRSRAVDAGRKPRGTSVARVVTEEEVVREDDARR